MISGVPEERLTGGAPFSIISLSLGGHAVVQQLDTALDCETCGRQTRHQVLYLGRRIAEVHCVECSRCIGVDRREVVRAFVGQVVMQTLRLPREVRRELKAGLGSAVATLPRQIAQLPMVLARDAIHLLRMAWTLEGNRGTLEAMFSQAGATMACTRCKQETPHHILYLGHRLAEARCDTCGHGLGMTREEVFSDFVGELVLHLLKLPGHVRQELRSDFAHAVQTLPRQIVRIPFHLARDFLWLVRLLRSPRQVGGRSKVLASSRGRSPVA